VGEIFAADYTYEYFQSQLEGSHSQTWLSCEVNRQKPEKPVRERERERVSGSLVDKSEYAKRKVMTIHIH